MKAKLAIFLSLLCVLLGDIAVAAAEVRLSAAASMTDAFKELVFVFSKEHPGVVVLPNFGSSGALAKQIAHGAPADLFVSANPKWMDYLVEEGKIAPQTVRVFAYNTLVLVGARSSAVSSLEELFMFHRIAIGSPAGVPAGQYAEQALRAAGVYEKLLDQNKLVMAKDVRQALLYADRGEVDGAFVYRTDALLAQNAVMLYSVPGNLHDRISYPIGLTPEGEKNSAAQAFYDYLASTNAIEIMRKYGFEAE